MKKSWLRWIGLVALLIVSCREPAREVRPEPKTEPQEESKVKVVRAGALEFSPAVQYKKAPIGTAEVEFTFTAVNLGSDPVRITKVDSGCACIAESATPELIPPGESSLIRALYATEKINGMAEKILSVSTDQPNVRDAFLTVKLEMDPIYVIDHVQTSWEKGGANKTRNVIFEVTRDQPITVLEVVSSRAEIKAELTELEKGRKYRISLTPTSTANNLLGFVRVKTDCEIEAHARPLLYVTVK